MKECFIKLDRKKVQLQTFISIKSKSNISDVFYDRFKKIEINSDDDIPYKYDIPKLCTM